MEKTPPPLVCGEADTNTCICVYSNKSVNLEQGKAGVGEVFPKEENVTPSHATIRRTTEPIASQTYGMNNPSAGIFKQSSGGLEPSRNRVVEPARQAAQAGGFDSLETSLGLIKC